MTALLVNNVTITINSTPDTPLLWVLREELKLLGTKFGCGAGLCGACTVLVDGQATRSCVLPIAALEGKSITTIEALGGQHPVQQAWIEGNVPQCGYCQSGQIMSAIGLLSHNPQPTTDEIRQAMSGNICRCGTYPRILSAIQRASQAMHTPAAGSAQADYYEVSSTVEKPQ